MTDYNNKDDKRPIEGKSPASEQRNESQADYDVGYKKPPKRYQFKPGESGNPKGRPKGAKKLATLFKEALDELVDVRVGGKVRRMPRRRALFDITMMKALGGNDRALLAIFKLAERLGELHPDAGSQVISGVFVLPMRPETPEEWQRIYGEAAKGTKIPQEIVDKVNKLTRRTE